MSSPKHHQLKNQSDLQALRTLAPNRQLTWTEETAVAARQANRLRQLHQQTRTLAFDIDIIATQPRLRIDADSYLSMAGSSHWTGSHWQILVNETDHPLRQRFTIAHEYKHIIDNRRQINPDFEERICDYFAANLLMPKRLVVAAWTQGQIERNLVAMAKAFAVSRPAMNYRLNQLGLVSPLPRCRNTMHPANRPSAFQNRSTHHTTANYFEPSVELLGSRQ